mgnify:FL=1
MKTICGAPKRQKLRKILCFVFEPISSCHHCLTPPVCVVDPASDAAFLIVRDEIGAVVSREQLPMSAETVLWGGVGSDGSPLESGLYAFEIESLNNGQVTSTRPMDHYALIREARLGNSGVEIVLSGGIAVASSEVRALRTPEP